MNSRVKDSVLKTLEEHKNLVWKEIEKYLKSPKFPKSFKVPAKYKDIEEFHWTATKEYPLRKGKYLRPTLLLLTIAAMGENPRLGLKTASALQLSEEWLLVHDDIEDQSLLRRGKPTLHRIYGIGEAVNVGDTLQTIMWKVFFDSLKIFEVKKFRQIFNEFYSILMRTELGQTVENKWSSEVNDFSDQDWYFLADGKTGFYSLAGPLRLGAIIAGTTPKQLIYLSEFGLELGRCFQLVDDILDVTSNFRGLKKKGGDIYEGKRTILLGHLLRTVVPKDRNRLLSILGKNYNEKTPEEVKWVISKMKDYGSIDYARHLAKIHKNKAERIFDDKLKFLSFEPQRTKIRQLIDFVLERDY